MLTNNTIDIPVRFSLVDNNKNRHIYRGGQPTCDQIKYLQSIGVKHIINLRREGLRCRTSEEYMCKEIHIDYHSFPHYGIFGIKPNVINEIVDFIESLNENVYIHCKNGRDRTSLIVASYLVKYRQKDLELAWKEDVLNYDHDENNIFYSCFKKSFDKFCKLINDNEL